MEPRTRTILMWTAVACLCFIGIPIHLKGEDEEKLELVFRNYSKAFDKSYDENDVKERLPHFKTALEKIHDLNAKEEERILQAIGINLKGADSRFSKEKNVVSKYVSNKRWKHGMPKNQGYAVYGLTEFADMSSEEFQKQYLSPRMREVIETREKHLHNKDSNHHHHHHHNRHRAEDLENSLIVRRKRRSLSFPGGIPDKVDWREKNAVTPILHQKGCGACWAFSTVETVESMRAIQTGKLEPLSVQYVIDCATNGNMGCSGGDTCGALSWMEGTKLVTAEDYPLTLKDSQCRLQKASLGVQINSNYTCDNYVGAEEELLTVLAHQGPVAAAVDATNWQYYVGGIIQWNCDDNHNHAVQIVGYDKTGTPPHYIVRNSWGTGFGDKGYLYVAIGSNLCGIAKQISSVSVMP